MFLEVFLFKKAGQTTILTGKHCKTLNFFFVNLEYARVRKSGVRWSMLE